MDRLLTAPKSIAESKLAILNDQVCQTSSSFSMTSSVQPHNGGTGHGKCGDAVKKKISSVISPSLLFQHNFLHNSLFESSSFFLFSKPNPVRSHFRVWSHQLSRRFPTFLTRKFCPRSSTMTSTPMMPLRLLGSFRPRYRLTRIAPTIPSQELVALLPQGHRTPRLPSERSPQKPINS